ncbi:MAG: patatin-like phospholipase family protein, partial [Burkholderiaceae bacterium]|nr:patatin-like phospholipase family protein [Burkholderiaceae bacterium]
MNDEQDAFDPKLEHERIRTRRALWEDRRPGADALPPEHPVGLAFSGGGIRSATFSLGLAQAIAAKKLFPQIDYLSTVSGGGYTGSFLGSLFLPRTADLGVPDPLQREAPQTAVESALAAAERAERL